MIFYAGINLGFGSGYKSQVNEAMLQAACYDLISDLRNLNPGNQFDTGLLKPDSEQKKSDELFIINNSFSPDSPFVAIDDSILSPIDSTGLSNLLDSTKITGKDSLKTKVKINQDSLRLVQMALDSTARLEYFRYQREDVPFTSLQQKKKSKFFVEPSPTYKSRSITIDSTGKFVEIKDIVAGKPNKIILRMPIEEYIATRLEVEERKKWEALGYSYQLKDSKLGLQDFMKSFTDFEIPLPSVGVLSIFGTPKISLKIGGSVQIHGAWRSETTEGVTASRLGNTKNEPDFKQQVQINVNGTIGDKLNIVADWNTERTFEYENQLKIKYTGYDDEIIQSIEAGNVSLQTSPLVGGSEALFGIKAQFKMGPFSLTTIASQKKGETKEVQVSGGTSETPFQKRAYEYSTNHYFIDTIYASKTEKIFFDYYGNPTPQVRSDLMVTDIQVWKSTNQISTDKSKERNANVYIDLDHVAVGQAYDESLRATLSNTVPGKIDAGRFRLLEPMIDYTLHEETGYITFKTSINDDEIIAVAFRQEQGAGSTDDDFIYGEFLDPTSTDSTRLILKMIKPRNLQPIYKTAWSLMLKNIYALGPRNIKPEGFEFDIQREIEGQEPASEVGTTRFLNAFGLDLLNASSQPPSDNIFDYRLNFTILSETGEVIFPNLEPFSDDLPPSLDYDTYNFDEVYDTTKTFAANKKIKDKWILVGKSKGTSSSVYQLGFNVVENSVKVLLNGRELSSGSDYIVDYNVGQLTIRNEAALVPGADVRITYEQNDLFQLASKTLLGARGIYEFSKKTKLGFSILNLNQQTLSDKVRIGEEPLSNTIYGVDFSTNAELPIVTKFLDNVFSTREMSTFNLSAEYAYINPDPNSKKSTILSDGGKSIAYIDDFEGAKKTIPIGVSYTAWKDLSPPDSMLFNPGLTKQQLRVHKAKTFWFTITPGDVTVQQIYGNKKQVARADQQVTVMDYVFLPDTFGTYNYDPQLEDRKKSWGGIQKILSSTANDLIEENIGFIEFWAQIQNAPADAKIYLDLGKISEDVIPNNELNTEDIDGNEAIDTEGKEDTGLDGWTDEQERAAYPNRGTDPSGDNFFFLRGSRPYPYDYFNINGTEGNAVLSDIGRLPDTEDLNRNGNPNLDNAYFRYEIPLDTNVATNPFIDSEPLNTDPLPVNKWYLYRIPIKEFTSTVGSPSFTDVETIRMFTHGVDSMVHFRITEFNLVGSQWQKNLPDSIERTDSVLSISVVSLEESEFYTSPPGVFQEKDRTRPDEDILSNEQSLSLILNGLEEGDKREVVKYLFRPLDVFNYKQMKLFVHGETDELGTLGSSSIAYADTFGGSYQYSSEVYFRFGGDTNNYYEYRQPVLPDWNEIAISFEDLTALKQLRGDTVTTPFKIAVPGAPPGHFYVIKGNPTLTTVKFLSVGVVNLNSAFNPGPLSGQVWINELRVIEADDSPGWAYSLSTSVKLADFATVSFNLSEKNPYFHRLADRFGSRVEQSNWSVSTDVNILKLIPLNLPESNLRLNYSHTESKGKPLYLPGSDVKVDKAIENQQVLFDNDTTGLVKSPELLKEETETYSVQDSWSASNIKLKIPTKWWLIRDTFNSITMGFNYNNAFSRSPTIFSNTSWIWNANMNYGISLSPDYYFNPIDIPIIGLFFSLLKDYSGTKIYFTPQNFSLALTAKRNSSTNITRARNNSPSNEVSSRDFTTTRGFNFTWKLTEGGFLNLTTSYSANINSSLAYLETYGDSAGTPRPESEIWNDIFSGAGFGQDSRYQQNFDIRTAPKLPSLLDMNKYFTLTASYGVSYQWNYDFRQEIVGRSAGFSSKSSVGLTMRWKSLFDPFFKEEVSKDKPPVGNLVGKDIRLNQELKIPKVDSLGNPIALTDSTEILDSLLFAPKKPSLISRGVSFLVAAAKYVFLDYEMISFNFSNDNTLSKSGLKATGTGFANFWGFSYDVNSGPTRGFMLGLSSDAGPRASSGNTNLSDVSSQKNNLDFKTSRPLWEGAKIDLNWKSGWSVNKNSTINVNDDGTIFVTNVNSTGTLNRSFLTIPPVLVFSVFNTGINQVAELYNPQDPNSSLSDAFVEGFETFPWLSKIPFLQDFANYIPRANWRITWDGLEKLPLLKSLADRISLDHSYSSTYTEGWKLNREGTEEIQVQKIEYGFAPLLGLNLTFGQLWGGNFSGNLKYSTRTSYDLGITTSNITENFSKDMGFTLQFSKSGFELPLFGLALKNDIEFSLAYSTTRSAAIRYDMRAFKEEGTPQDGTTRVTIEPRIKYTISAKVTLSIFYKRSTVEPEGASRIPPTTTNEAGLDVNISIN